MFLMVTIFNAICFSLYVRISTSSISSTILLCYSAGVQWVEMHKLAERVELEELKKCGILHGDVEEMMKVNKVP